MPIRDVHFSKLTNYEPERPYLFIKIINPENNEFYRTLALVDTGADSCVFPANIATILGHRLEKGKVEDSNTAAGPSKAYLHSTKIEVYDFQGTLLYKLPRTLQVRYMSKLNIPLLGVQNFLNPFNLHIQYPKKFFSITNPK